MSLATNLKRSLIICLAALTLAVGATAAIQGEPAQALGDRRCMMYPDDVDFYRCLGVPMPQ